MKITRSVLAVAALASCANGSMTTFLGEDLAGSSLTNTRSAQQDFLNQLSAATIEGFESLPNLQRAPFTVTFDAGSPQELAATFTANPRARVSQSTAGGAFATEGDQYLRVVTPPSGEALRINLSQAATSFGFVITDPNDTGTELSVVLSLASGGTRTVIVPVTGSSDGSTSGSAAFFGLVVDQSEAFVGINFVTTPEGSPETFGLDELVIAVPAPGTTVLAASGALIAMRRRRG